MRLLFDGQLSEELVTLLHDLFPDSLHILVLGAGGSPDSRAWQLARDHGCLLVTKDEDFHRLSILRGAPPKVVWIRPGNCNTEALARVLRQHAKDIWRFAEQDEATFLELG